MSKFWWDELGEIMCKQSEKVYEPSINTHIYTRDQLENDVFTTNFNNLKNNKIILFLYTRYLQ